MKHLLALLIVCAASIAYGQNQMSNNWVMGRGARVDFSMSPPQVSTGLKAYTSHSSSAISDSLSNLLFYTNGDSIYNATYNTMPNGENLVGSGKYSFQGVIIVPAPGNPHQYYVFNVSDKEDTISHPGKLLYGGLVCHVVDMSLDGGLGDVIIRDSVVFQSTDNLSTFEQRITAARHANDTDYWIIVRKWDGTGTSHFYTYLLDSNGLNPPIISGASQTQNGVGFHGEMKVAPDGSKIAMTAGKLATSTGMMDPNYLEVFCFNNQSGKAAPSTLYEAADFANLALSFSPNGKLLYFTGCGFGAICGTYQIDLELNAMVQVHSSPANYMQLGPDGILYLNPNCTSFNCIDAILSPNKLGAQCNYTASYLTLPPNSLSIGLCNMIDANTGNPASFMVDFTWQNMPNPCDSLTWKFVNTYPGSAANWLWLITDSNGLVIDSSLLSNPVFTFSKAGIYSIELIGYEACKADTTIKLFSIINDGLYSSANAIDICEGDSVFAEGNYQFTGGTFVDSLISISGCDSLVITELTVHPQFMDTIQETICEGDSILIGSSYQSVTGVYENIAVSSNGCDSSTYIDLNVVNIVLPSIYANGNELITEAGYTYQWYINGVPIAGATAQNYTAWESGMYAVMVTDSNGCSMLTPNLQISITGIFQPMEGPSFKVYPNPAFSKISVEWKGPGYPGEIEVSIRDISGKEVLSAIFNQQAIASIDLGGIAPGMYFMHVKAMGENSVVKIVKSQ